MSHQLIIRPEAEEDLLNARQWYERQRPGLGGAFMLSVEAAMEEIRRRPMSFPIVRKQARGECLFVGFHMPSTLWWIR
jgi:hypothetical protein